MADRDDLWLSQDAILRDDEGRPVASPWRTYDVGEEIKEVRHSGPSGIVRTVRTDEGWELDFTMHDGVLTIINERPPVT